jgi:hypothetical protein
MGCFSAFAGPARLVVWPENRSFRLIHPEDFTPNHGNFARFGEKTTLYQAIMNTILSSKVFIII